MLLLPASHEERYIEFRFISLLEYIYAYAKSYYLLLLFSVPLSGALSYLDETYPGAYHTDEGIAYVSVGGDAVVGKQPQQKQSAFEGNGSKEGSKEFVAIFCFKIF